MIFMGTDARLNWVKLEHELHNRAKTKEEIPDGTPVFLLEDVTKIGEMVGRECWKTSTDTYKTAIAGVEKKKKIKLPNIFTEWRREKAIHVIRGLIYQAAEKFKQKKGLE